MVRHQLGKKKLSLMIASALAFGSVLTSGTDAFAAEVEIAKGSSESTYKITVDGAVKDPNMQYASALAFVRSEAAKDDAVLKVMSADVATALSGKSITLGKNSVIQVAGATNQATIANGDAPSAIQVDGAQVKGANVNLKSIEMSATGKTAKVALSGHIGTLDIQGGTVDFKGTDTLTVEKLTTSNSKARTR